MHPDHRFYNSLNGSGARRQTYIALPDDLMARWSIILAVATATPGRATNITTSPSEFDDKIGRPSACRSTGKHRTAFLGHNRAAPQSLTVRTGLRPPVRGLIDQAGSGLQDAGNHRVEGHRPLDPFGTVVSDLLDLASALRDTVPVFDAERDNTGNELSALNEQDLAQDMIA